MFGITFPYAKSLVVDNLNVLREPGNLLIMRTCAQKMAAAAEIDLKGNYYTNLLSFQKPKMFIFQQKQRNNCQVCYKLSPQCNKTVD